MSAVRYVRWMVLAAAVMLAGCPTPGVTSNPLSTPEEGDPVVSVCYPPLVTDDGEVTPIALEACANAGVDDPELRYWKKNLVFNDCPLFKKARRSWFCEPGYGSERPDGPQHELYLPPAAAPGADGPASSPEMTPAEVPL